MRLWSIEFFKLQHTRYFWVLSVLVLIFMISVPIASKVFLDYLGEQGEHIFRLDILPSELPVFDFVDIWQNLTWVYRNFSIFLGFIIVISVSNEFSYGTIKQNVIDGMSRQQFLWSKISWIIGSSVVVSLITLIIGLIMGFAWSPVTEFTFIIKSIEFIPAYTLHLIAFQMFCLVAVLLIKRSGIVIAGLIFYIYIIEKIAWLMLTYDVEWPAVADLLPVVAINNIIPLPFTKYALMETQTTVGMGHLAILLIYTALFYYISHHQIVKRDLR